MKRKISVKVPESLDEVGVKMFQLFHQIEQSDKDTITKSIEMVSVIANLPVDTVQMLDDRSIIKLAEHINIVFSSNTSLKILGNYNGASPINLEDLTIGQFIDIFMLLEKKIDNAQSILTQFYWQGKYSGTDYKYAAKFNEYPISAYNEVYNKIVKFYSDTMSEFSNIFKKADSEAKVLTNQGAFQNKWGWYIMFHNLSQGNILNMESVTNLHYREVLTFQSYVEDYNRIHSN